MGFFVRPAQDHVDGKTWNDENVACCPGCGSAAVPCDPNNRHGNWRHVAKPLSCREDDEFPSMCYFVEFGVLYDDRTWDTVVAEVPTKYCHDDCKMEDLLDWVNVVLGSQACYRKVVQFTVFSVNPHNG